MLPSQTSEEGVNNCCWKIPIKVRHSQGEKKRQILSANIIHFYAFLVKKYGNIKKEKERDLRELEKKGRTGIDQKWGVPRLQDLPW